MVSCGRWLLLRLRWKWGNQSRSFEWHRGRAGYCKITYKTTNKVHSILFIQFYNIFALAHSVSFSPRNGHSHLLNGVRARDRESDREFYDDSIHRKRIWAFLLLTDQNDLLHAILIENAYKDGICIVCFTCSKFNIQNRWRHRLHSSTYRMCLDGMFRICFAAYSHCPHVRQIVFHSNTRAYGICSMTAHVCVCVYVWCDSTHDMMHSS